MSNDSRGGRRAAPTRGANASRNGFAKQWMVAIAVVAAVAAIIGGLAYASRPDPTKPQANFDGNGASGKPVDGIKCSTQESVAFHIHSHLDIFKDGQKVAVPQDIGIPGNCLYWLHTHDTSGVIHVESPVQRQYTLGNFFDVWGAPLSRRKVLGFDAGQSEPLRVYVNGKLYKGNPRNVPLKEHEEIALVIGKTQGEPPASYDFPQGE